MIRGVKIVCTCTCSPQYMYRISTQGGTSAPTVHVLDMMHLSYQRLEVCRCAVVVLVLVGYCTVLYSTVLYCTVLYCTVLYCTVLYCAVLYCTVLYCTVRTHHAMELDTKRKAM